ncbi:hypothetical protein F2Q69_00011561 [Brassica cretica]|uniref:Uncharacterized protein n=1 Tax=Brassica cretica TaxID=69181 RepID=A0A8S9QQ90_BRACR|nr:hypothetical protein F2Q69_00011561 [Brassica cretica]
MEKRKVVMCGVLSLLGLLSAITAFAAEATRIKQEGVLEALQMAVRSISCALWIS